MAQLRALVVVVSVLFASSLPAATITVDSSGGADHADIQSALDASADGDTVLVMPGEYVVAEPIDFNKLHSPDDPASPPAKNIVLRSEAGPAATAIRLAQTPADSKRTCAVVFQNGETTASVLEGFTVAGGAGFGFYFEDLLHGGVCCRSGSSPRIAGCRISGNPGDGIMIRDASSPVIDGCEVSENGRGIYGYRSSPTLQGCTISGNKSSGLSTEESAPVLTDCMVSGNEYWGLLIQDGSSADLTGCTISGNYSGISNWGSLKMTSCIVWGNSEYEIDDGYGSEAVEISHSCVKGPEAPPGTGNINVDPLFCGFGSQAEVHVDASAAGPGDGSAESPYKDIRAGLDYSLALSAGSPCIGAGKDGANMGAPHGTCAAAGAASRLVHLAAGRYEIALLNLTHSVSIEGESREETVIAGPVCGLRTGARLSSLTIEGGGIEIGSGEAPSIDGVTVSDSPTSGLVLSDSSAAAITNCTFTGCAYTAVGGSYCAPTLTDCAISGNLSDGMSGIGFKPILVRCVISGNGWNGIACEDESALTLEGCTIAGNTRSGISIAEGSSADLSDCAIAGNGDGGIVGSDSSVYLIHCTVTGNAAIDGGGVALFDGELSMTSCVVWDNVGGSFPVDSDLGAISYSCIQWPEAVQGTGNIDGDPLFGGWGRASEVYVDAARPGPGDGSAGSPFPRLADALEYDLAIAKTSPCIGAGMGGTNMGASRGVCEEAGVPERLVRIAPGAYRMAAVNLAHRASLRGASEEETAVDGLACGLRTGASVSALSLPESAARTGIVVAGGEAPSIDHVTVSGCEDPYYGAIACFTGARPTFTDCSIVNGAYQGVHLESGASPTLERCAISGGRGTGLDARDASSTLIDCAISGNPGGGVRLHGASSAHITGCTIFGNQSSFDAGGICIEGTSSAVLADCSISGNMAKKLGGGILCSHTSSTAITGCTIAGNAGNGGGISISDSASVIVTNSIIWDNAGGSILASGDVPPSVTWSCIEGAGAWPGTGNIASDPLFCGFAGGIEVYVDASAAGPGDGSAASPFRDLRAALDFNLGLSIGSPCLGTGEGGANMGADLGSCGEAGAGYRIVRLAPGVYPVGDINLAHGVTISGGGDDASTIEGTVWGLRTGASLSSLAVAQGPVGGIHVCLREAPAIDGVAVRRCRDDGVCCSGSSPALSDCTIEENYGNGLTARDGATPVLTGCTLRANSIIPDQGAISCNSSAPTLHGCRIIGNGGQALSCYGSSPALVNCIIAGNLPGTPGIVSGIVSCEIGSSPALINCTISGNTSRYGAEAILCRNSTPALKNCIVWGNSADSTCGSIQSCLTGDPRFVSAGEYDFDRYRLVNVDGLELKMPDFVVVEPDFRLRPGSPAIDAGVTQGAPATDIDGNARPSGAAVDIGAYEYTLCSMAGDVHCLGLEVKGPDGGGPGTYVVTASARDDSGGSISYTFTVRRGDEAPIVVGPQAENTASFSLGEGGWTVSVVVDDDPMCADGADAACSLTVIVYTTVGRQLPGDLNQDGRLDLSDAVWLLGHLFLGLPGLETLPCEGGTASSPGPGDLTLADSNGDARIDISDPLSILGHLFLGGMPPVLGTECVRIDGCPERCR